MAQHNIKGKQGEALASQYLKDKGYTILHENWRYRHLELDIVAQHEDTLVVIEVKTRSNDDLSQPTDAIDYKKIRYLLNATQAYINHNHIEYDVRFDVISIILNDEETNIEHIEDAFYPPIS